MQITCRHRVKECAVSNEEHGCIDSHPCALECCRVLQESWFVGKCALVEGSRPDVPTPSPLSVAFETISATRQHLLSLPNLSRQP